MAKKILLTLALVLILVVTLTSSVRAATYSFSLDRLNVIATINQDGTMSIDYTFDFTNDSGADPIDFVDVGIPVDAYDIHSISADVNGQSITDIQKSSYIDIGVALGLGQYAIQPGQTGRVHAAIGIVRKMIYPYTNGNTKNYVSFNFSPTWFDSSSVHGSTDSTVTLRLPPGPTANEPIFYKPVGWPGEDYPATGFDKDNRIFYTWHSASANGYTQYKFGAGFPAQYIPAAAIVHEFPIKINLEDWIFPGCILGFLAIVGVGIYQGAIGDRKRKLQYLPPKISIEGHGIKRGLTAVEAAILMEQPLDKILTMVLFGVIKKNAASVVSKDPLKLTITSPLPVGLYPYETDFLNAFQGDKKDVQKQAIQKMVIALVKSVTEKIKGFSRKESIAYYQDIMKNAWGQVEAAGTPEVKSAKFDEVMEWTMLDHDYSTRTRNVFNQGPVIVPIWWGRYDPLFHSQTGSISTPMTPISPTAINMPHLPGSDFAASMVNGAQSFSSNLLGDVTAFTSGITNATNPAPPPSHSSSGGGHSGGCACACACAGCACACAGGGR